ncbi:unnamed protein product [Lota lota]
MWIFRWKLKSWNPNALFLFNLVIADRVARGPTGAAGARRYDGADRRSNPDTELRPWLSLTPEPTTKSGQLTGPETVTAAILMTTGPEPRGAPLQRDREQRETRCSPLRPNPHHILHPPSTDALMELHGLLASVTSNINTALKRMGRAGNGEGTRVCCHGEMVFSGISPDVPEAYT